MLNVLFTLNDMTLSVSRMQVILSNRLLKTLEKCWAKSDIKVSGSWFLAKVVAIRTTGIFDLDVQTGL